MVCSPGEYVRETCPADTVPIRRDGQDYPAPYDTRAPRYSAGASRAIREESNTYNAPSGPVIT
jgi:hypothetical protein